MASLRYTAFVFEPADCGSLLLRSQFKDRFQSYNLITSYLDHSSPIEKMTGEEHCRPAYLEEVFAMFKRHSHPLVLVDNMAMRWLGSSNMPTDVSWT